MNSYSKTYEVKWADMDPNYHMRHSVYLDYAAQIRISIFADYGLSIDKIAKIGLGPIMFREEIKYLKEVHMMEEIVVHCKIKQMRRGSSRWSFYHQIFKNDDTAVAEITVDGAWLDLDTRKLGIPPDRIMEIMGQYPRTENFKWMP